MMELWGTNTASKWLPANYETGLPVDNDNAARIFDTAARMILFKQSNAAALKGYAESGVVHYVEI